MDNKFHQFDTAIKKYHTMSRYTQFECLLSIIVILAQLFSVLNLLQAYPMQSMSGFLLALIFAYIAADFVNGFVHMIVDNTSHFTSVFGPFIAAFHVHHYRLKYKEAPAIKIYFYESGHKFWLVIYLLVLIYAQKTMHLLPNLNLGLVSFGILSSVAELSHYWCHKQKGNNRLITYLQKKHLLLPFKHHRLHHTHDNMNYAFLNGMTDPLLNLIARYCYKGYKNHSDKYVLAYFKKNRPTV